MCGFSIILILNKVFKPKNPCILLNKNVNYNKNETESKMENPAHSFRETNHVLQLQLWWVGTRERKKGHFLYRLFRPKRIFKICVLSQCIVYWTDLQIKHTFTYQKTLLHTLLLRIFKIVKGFQCILKTWLPKL